MASQVCLRTVNYDLIWDYLKAGVTHYCGAPTVQNMIVSHPQAKKLDQIVVSTVAGAAPTPTVINRLEKLNINVTHVYG